MEALKKAFEGRTNFINFAIILLFLYFYFINNFVDESDYFRKIIYNFLAFVSLIAFIFINIPFFSKYFKPYFQKVIEKFNNKTKPQEDKEDNNIKSFVEQKFAEHFSKFNAKISNSYNKNDNNAMNNLNSIRKNYNQQVNTRNMDAEINSIYGDNNNNSIYNNNNNSIYNNNYNNEQITYNNFNNANYINYNSFNKFNKFNNEEEKSKYTVDNFNIGDIYKDNDKFNNLNSSYNEKEVLFDNIYLTNNIISNLNLPKSLNQIRNDVSANYNKKSMDDMKDTGIEVQKMSLWINNLKKFIYSSLIPSNLEEHKSNLNSINDLTKHSIGINFVSKIKFHKNTFDLKDLILQRLNSLNKLSLKEKVDKVFASENIEQSDTNLIELHFGDSEFIYFLLDRIEDKILRIREENSLQIKSNLVNKENENMRHIKENFFSDINLYKKDTKKFNFSNTVNQNYKEFENNLVLLKEFLEERLQINNRLIPNNFNNKIKNKYHLNLIISYSIKRLSELESEKLENYQNNSGGNYGDISWFTGFPTDSQLISSLFFNFIQLIYKEKDSSDLSNINESIEKQEKETKEKQDNTFKNFVVYHPLEPKLDEEKEGLVFYQYSPDNTEPYLIITHKKDYLFCPSGVNNFYHATIMFLYLLKRTFNQSFKVKKIEDFINCILEQDY